MLDGEYKVREHEKAIFRERWCGPVKYEHGKPRLVAVYEKTAEDGQAAHVYCEATPARFYEVRTTDLVFSFGGDQGVLARDIAKAISNGMLAVRKRP